MQLPQLYLSLFVGLLIVFTIYVNLVNVSIRVGGLQSQTQTQTQPQPQPQPLPQSQFQFQFQTMLEQFQQLPRYLVETLQMTIACIFTISIVVIGRDFTKYMSSSETTTIQTKGYINTLINVVRLLMATAIILFIFVALIIASINIWIFILAFTITSMIMIGIIYLLNILKRLQP